MTHKANISMNSMLYEWLRTIGIRMGSRSVPGVARSILIAVKHASESEDAAFGMMSLINIIRQESQPKDDSQFIASMMEDLSDADRLDPGQRANIKRRF